jgi:hypothetical protein
MALGFVVLERKKIILTQGFEHVKEYAALVVGKRRVCSEDLEHHLYLILEIINFT